MIMILDLNCPEGIQTFQQLGLELLQRRSTCLGFIAQLFQGALGFG
jgi:hypothetical protein